MCITHISCFVELEKVLNMVGEVATRLKNRLDMIYGSRKDTNERMFSGAHETVLPLCSSARSIFNQLRNTTTRKASKRLQPRAVWTRALPQASLVVLTVVSLEWTCVTCCCCPLSSCLT